ncbi:MAG: OmpH family outer membrane protein [Chitinophagaceae bacterium]|nr:OmpH family outer membrane protein [Chitinophagaceae bacterium]
MKQFLTAAFITVTALTLPGQTEAQSKIGYISTEELVSIMPETAKADSNLTQYREALIQVAQDKENALQAAIEKFNLDSAKMSTSVKDIKRADLQKMLTELQGESQKIQQQLQQRQQELITPINKKAFDAIQAVAKESGYTYVFEKGALLVAPPSDDILPLVAKKLNVKIPSAVGKPGAAPAAPQRPSTATPSK